MSDEGAIARTVPLIQPSPWVVPCSTPVSPTTASPRIFPRTERLRHAPAFPSRQSCRQSRTKPQNNAQMRQPQAKQSVRPWRHYQDQRSQQHPPRPPLSTHYAPNADYPRHNQSAQATRPRASPWSTEIASALRGSISTACRNARAKAL